MGRRAITACALIAGCGRLGFDGPGDGTRADARVDAPPDATQISVTWVKPVVAHHTGVASVDSFSYDAVAAGDAIVVMAACDAVSTPTSVTISGSGWAFTPLGAIVGSVGAGRWAQGFVTIVPDTANVQLGVQWDITCDHLTELGDEFTNIDPHAVVDAYVAVENDLGCNASFTNVRAGDAVWAACDPTVVISGPGAGYQVGADDLAGDQSEHRTTIDPAGATETVTFQGGTGSSVMTVVAIAHR